MNDFGLSAVGWSYTAHPPFWFNLFAQDLSFLARTWCLSWLPIFLWFPFKTSSPPVSSLRVKPQEEEKKVTKADFFLPVSGFGDYDGRGFVSEGATARACWFSNGFLLMSLRVPLHWAPVHEKIDCILGEFHSWTSQSCMIHRVQLRVWKSKPKPMVGCARHASP